MFELFIYYLGLGRRSWGMELGFVLL